MDQNLKAYEGFLNNIIENPNYVATAEENTAAYNIQSDVTYADLSNELQGCQSYEEQLSVLKKYVSLKSYNLYVSNIFSANSKSSGQSISTPSILSTNAMYGLKPIRCL